MVDPAEIAARLAFDKDFLVECTVRAMAIAAVEQGVERVTMDTALLVDFINTMTSQHIKEADDAA